MTVVYFGVHDLRVQTGTGFKETSGSDDPNNPWPATPSPVDAELTFASSIRNTSSEGPDCKGSGGCKRGRMTGLFVGEPGFDGRRIFLLGREGECLGDSLGGPGLMVRIMGCGISWSASHSPWFAMARSYI